MRAHLPLKLHSKARSVLRELVFLRLCASFHFGKKRCYTLFGFGNPTLVWNVKTLHSIETATQGLIGFESQREIAACFGLCAELPQTFHRALHYHAQRGIPFDGSFIVSNSVFVL